MAATASLPQRFLYYWSLLYTSQLARGDDYGQLCPTISICFVNRRMFTDADSYHRRFRLTDTKGSLELTCDLDIHVFELVNFRKQLGDLNDPLDFWLFFLKNGDTLDADELPAPLDTHELRQAIAEIDAAIGAHYAAEAAGYLHDFLPVLNESVVLCPVVLVRDGTYRSFIPQGFQDRGPLAQSLPEEANIYSHCGPYHADYVITSAAIEAWLRAGVLSVDDPRSGSPCAHGNSVSRLLDSARSAGR